MDSSEQHAVAFLKHLGYSDVQPHPDGENFTPDVLVNGRIAVEVRRLNQSYENNTERCDLEKISIPLWKNIKKLLPTLGPPPDGETSWFIAVSFRRPVEEWRKIRPKIVMALRSFMADKDRRITTFQPSIGITINLFKASNSMEAFFVLGGINDDDSGGWLAYEFYKNLRLCIDEKSLKTSNRRHLYPEWWLILIDHIGYGVESPHELLEGFAPIVHDWHKVYVIHPHDSTRGFELSV